MVKFHHGAKIHGLGLGRASSQTVNLLPSVEFHYFTLVIMNESINLHLSNVSPVAVQYNALRKLDR